MYEYVFGGGCWLFYLAPQVTPMDVEGEISLDLLCPLPLHDHHLVLFKESCLVDHWFHCIHMLEKLSIGPAAPWVTDQPFRQYQLLHCTKKNRGDNGLTSERTFYPSRGWKYPCKSQIPPYKSGINTEILNL